MKYNIKLIEIIFQLQKHNYSSSKMIDSLTAFKYLCMFYYKIQKL